MKPLPNLRLAFALALVLGAPAPLLDAAEGWPSTVRRVVILGDSITYSGQYVAMGEAFFHMQWPDREAAFLNLGLPSETVSGLSEPGHASGEFPRPDLHERLERVLARTKPELVLACYGMNDGIYYPFSEERFTAFRDGITRLREEVIARGARLVHVTPSVFDPLPIREKTLPAGREEYRQPFEGYDEVLGRYSAWLVDQRTNGWDVIDTHEPMRAHLQIRRQENAQFTLAGDGVHLNDEGHWIVAREILRYFGAPPEIVALPTVAALLARHPQGEALYRRVKEKQRLLTDAWLTEIGHKRPGMPRGLPLAEAESKAARLDEEIRALAKPRPTPPPPRSLEGYYRFPALHGDTLVFTAEGDLWRVGVGGGIATRLTTHAGTEAHAAISPDGQVLAFSAGYEGPQDVYTMPLNGGLPQRHTFVGDATVAGWTPEGKILFTTRAYATLPNEQMLRLDPHSGQAQLVPLSQASEGALCGRRRPAHLHPAAVPGQQH